MDPYTGYSYQSEDFNKGSLVGNPQTVDNDSDQDIHGQKQYEDHRSVIAKSDNDACGSSEAVCDNNPTSFSNQLPNTSFSCTSASQNIVGNLLQLGQPDVKKVNNAAK